MVTVKIADCCDVLRDPANHERFHAGVSDLPYGIGIHSQEWDETGLAFSQELWTALYHCLKPGAYMATLCAADQYHRVATAAERAGFKVCPPLQWQHDAGFPKGIMAVSELIDREQPNRRINGYKPGSGLTRANVRWRAQGRSHEEFAVRTRYLTQESAAWAGWYYGAHVLYRRVDPILLVQKAVPRGGMLQNIRQHGTGALNVKALAARQQENWARAELRHPKVRQTGRHLHPTPKQIDLMGDLVVLLTPPGGHVLDPCAGTGPTGAAAVAHGFDATLIDIDPEMESVIRRRIEMAEWSAELNADLGEYAARGRRLAAD